MTKVYVGLGSNLGNREKNLDNAVVKISECEEISLVNRSGYYETKPVGGPQQPDYFNCVLELGTEVDPFGLLKFFKRIEYEFGRRTGVRWGPRVIDIDILLYGDVVMNHNDLKIPHESMHERVFVLEPLNEIAPKLIHPVFKKSIFELFRRCMISRTC